MLNEIFKGMDNSAEQINENFKKIEERAWEGPYTAELMNGWSEGNNGGINFEKSPDGIVYVSGLILPGTRTAGTVICQLPEGFRPTSVGRAHSFVVKQSGTDMPYLGFNITSSGDLLIQAPASSEISSTLGIQFHTMFRGGI